MDRLIPLLLVALLVVGSLALLLPQHTEQDDAPAPTPTPPGERFPAAGEEVEERSATPMMYGMGVHSLPALQDAGVSPDHATLWIGPWNLEKGWGEPVRQVETMKEAGVMPAIHFYYWGDDLTRACFETGCFSPVHDVHKDQRRWHALADAFITEMNQTLSEWPTLILLETEFNKQDVASYEPLDQALADMAERLRRDLPNATIILPLGNWNAQGWGHWDDAAAASDYIGIQALRGSTQDSTMRYMDTYAALQNGAEQASGLFDKPVVIHDLALSTYPEPAYVQPQRIVLQEIFRHLDDLKDAGVEGITYRSWFDNADKPLGNHYGPAERHWGLTHADGTEKPAAEVWIEGVRRDRGATSDPEMPPFK